MRDQRAGVVGGVAGVWLRQDDLDALTRRHRQLPHCHGNDHCIVAAETTQDRTGGESVNGNRHQQRNGRSARQQASTKHSDVLPATVGADVAVAMGAESGAESAAVPLAGVTASASAADAVADIGGFCCGSGGRPVSALPLADDWPRLPLGSVAAMLTRLCLTERFCITGPYSSTGPKSQSK